MYDSLTPELFLSIQTPSLVLKRLLICLTRRQIASPGPSVALVPNRFGIYPLPEMRRRHVHPEIPVIIPRFEIHPLQKAL